MDLSRCNHITLSIGSVSGAMLPKNSPPFTASVNPGAVPVLLLLVYAGFTLPCRAQYLGGCQSPQSPDFARILSFGGHPGSGVPEGWMGGPTGTLFADAKVVHGGSPSVRIERHPGSPSKFSALTNCVLMDFDGKTLEMRGFLRTENVNGFAALWIREDGNAGPVAFNSTQNRGLHGTTGWAEYSIAVPVKGQGKQLFFGVVLGGTGKAWASGLQLLVDGKPIWEVPKAKRFLTILDLDHQFDKGSGIVIHHLTPTQIENLVILGKVWGFLKYYDPQVTSGHRQWDYDLFRILPVILAAPDRARANAALVQWIKGLGPVAPCSPCAHLDDNILQLRPDLRWIDDENRLGTDLSQSLRWIRDNGRTGEQFYVSLASPVKNPVFEHELAYPAIKFPDAGFQLLALYRFWSIIEYWSPYRNVVGENWDKVLAEFISRLVLAKDRNGYQRQLMALIAMAHDTHANLWSSLQVRPPVGSCHVPVRLRFIQNQAVVTAYMDGQQGTRSGLKIGDVITKLDGLPVLELVRAWAPYYADSNEAARLRDIGTYMTRGACGYTAIGIRRGARDTNLNLEIKRVPLTPNALNFVTHDLPGPTFRLLSPRVAYLKLSSVNASQAANYIERATGAKGLIIDLRDYPSEFVVFALGSLLVNQQTPFARFTIGDLSNPGAFHWTPPESLTPQKPRYAGKVVILVDESTQSQAEYTAMAFRTAPGAIVVGSTTAGADGNVSPFALPGGLRSMISGIGVFYPDFRPTQRLGIVPDEVVRPTIAGILAGRDEVLEAALREILGPEVPASQIQNMYPHRSNGLTSN
jgi:C-terminal processing protease CtpA/Prc